MDPKKLSIRLSAKGKKEEKAGKEDRRIRRIWPSSGLGRSFWEGWRHQ